MYTSPSKADYIDTKGIQLVRRDNCPLVREMSGAMLDAIMHDKRADKAIEIAQRYVLDVLRGAIDIDKFIVSKTLRGGYKNATQPHVFVAEKLRRRRGHAVNHGERVPYVFVEDLAKPDALQAERAEDPAFARDNNLVLDHVYYIEHQLQSPIRCLLELMVDDPADAVFGHPDIAPIMKELKDRRALALRAAKRVRKNAANGQPEITRWFAPKPPAN